MSCNLDLLSHFRTMKRSLESIESLTIDFERDERRVVTRDGQVVVQTGGARPINGPLDFKCVTFRPMELLLELVVPSGDKLER